jgi:hypothetical protein
MPYDARAQKVELTTLSTTTPVISFGHAINGEVRIDAGEAMVTLTYYSCNTEDGVFYPCRDSTGTAITQTVAHTNAYQLPASLFGRKYLRITANAAGDVYLTTQA